MIKVEHLATLFPTLDQKVLKDVVENTPQKDILPHLTFFLPPKSHLLEAIQEKIREENLMIILRGLPGSGKSTLASLIAQLINHSDDDVNDDRCITNTDTVRGCTTTIA